MDPKLAARERFESARAGLIELSHRIHAHPELGLTVSVIGTPAVNHQPEFTRHCVTGQADEALCDGALAMAWTCIDLALRTGKAL